MNNKLVCKFLGENNYWKHEELESGVSCINDFEAVTVPTHCCVAIYIKTTTRVPTTLSL